MSISVCSHQEQWGGFDYWYCISALGCWGQSLDIANPVLNFAHQRQTLTTNHSRNMLTVYRRSCLTITILSRNNHIRLISGPGKELIIWAWLCQFKFALRNFGFDLQEAIPLPIKQKPKELTNKSLKANTLAHFHLKLEAQSSRLGQFLFLLYVWIKNKELIHQSISKEQRIKQIKLKFVSKRSNTKLHLNFEQNQDNFQTKRD